ncbi:hypothetical protein DSO57_1039466 [Entomophthora muscae]|uniref:Uncharacterized protein n=1 Tax=Entomophthora muscae TaxID=34485 RepID=A0ACC2U877_9FUNG|nr:hypothetical protein DSO57_1039466 [Entomophthora muscae]
MMEGNINVSVHYWPDVELVPANPYSELYHPGEGHSATLKSWIWQLHSLNMGKEIAPLN